MTGFGPGPGSEIITELVDLWLAGADEEDALAARVSTCPGPGGKPPNMPIECGRSARRQHAQPAQPWRNVS